MKRSSTTAARWALAKKATWSSLLALGVMLFATAVPAFAQHQSPIMATGVLQMATPDSPDPTPVYAITDEATGTSYRLISGFVNLEDCVR